MRIIGIGSPHGVDAAGWRAVEAFQRDGLAQRFPAGLVSLENCRAPVHLYGLVAGCRLAVLVDAVLSGGCQPLSVEPLVLSSAADRNSLHAVGVAEMLQLLDVLAARPPRVLVFGLPMHEGAGQQESERRLQQMLPALCRRIEDAVRHWLREGDREVASNSA